MNGTDVDVLRSAIDWLDSGHRVTLGTVVRTWGSAPRPPGSLMVLRDDGQVAGSLSGGCIEDDLIARVERGELGSTCRSSPAMAPRPRRRSASACPAAARCRWCWSRCRRSRSCASCSRPSRHTGWSHGAWTWPPAWSSWGAVRRRHAALRRRRCLTTVHGPRLRLVIIGGGQLSRYLASDGGDARLPRHRLRPARGVPRGLAGDAGRDAGRAACPMTWCIAMNARRQQRRRRPHARPQARRPGADGGAETPAFYVGALGSRRNNDARRERLLQFEVSRERIGRLHGPVGLRLGGLTPPEIALAIVAEMTAVRRGVDLAAPLADWSPSVAACRTTAG